MSRLGSLLCLLIVSLAPALVVAQTTSAPSPVVRDPRALSLANQSLQATSTTVALSDITLQGTVTYTAGSDFESGTVMLQAKGNVESLVALNLDGGHKQEVRNGPAGLWIGSDSQVHLMPAHNCATDAPWFFPILSLQSLSTDPQVSIVYSGPDSRNGISLLHVRLYRTVPNQTAFVAAQVQGLSALDLYLDAASYLPVILDFQTHADNDLNVSIPVEIVFADYRLVNGVKVPFRIQKSIQGSLLLDITLSGATANSGLSDSLFAVPTQ